MENISAKNDLTHQDKMGVWFYAISIYLCYCIFMVLQPLIFVYYYMHTSLEIIEYLMTSILLPNLIILIWAIVSFLKRQRPFPYLLSVFIIIKCYQILFYFGITLIRDSFMYSGEENMSDDIFSLVKQRFLSLPTLDTSAFILFLFLSIIVGLYLIYSKRVKNTFIH